MESALNWRLNIKDAALVSTSRLLFLSANKYQYRRNLEDFLQDIRRNATATVFLQKYTSKFKFRLPTLSMTCNLWPVTSKRNLPGDYWYFENSKGKNEQQRRQSLINIQGWRNYLKGNKNCFEYYLIISGGFEFTEGKITVNLWRKSRGNVIRSS